VPEPCTRAIMVRSWARKYKKQMDGLALVP
jgi:hypothetical protein